jgi:hypothetical protein
MNHPHVTFQYDIEKDIANLRIGLNWAKKANRNDGEINQIIRECGDNPTDEQLRTYIKNWWHNKEHIQPLILEPLQSYWNSVEQSFFEKLYKEMQLTSWYEVENIKSFLSIRYGCGYDNKENWFATSAHASSFRNTATAMHEIMHLFFHKQWWDFCLKQGVEDVFIWNIKEAFTTLLNTWFKDVLIDKDFGYPENQNLRAKIREWNKAGDDFKTMCEKACAYTKEHPEEHAGMRV